MRTEWGTPGLANSLFTLGLMIGISVNDTTVGTTTAPATPTGSLAPLFEGDTVNVTTEIAAKRDPARSRTPGSSISIHRAFGQDGTLVADAAARPS